MATVAKPAAGNPLWQTKPAEQLVEDVGTEGGTLKRAVGALDLTRSASAR